MPDPGPCWHVTLQVEAGIAVLDAEQEEFGSHLRAVLWSPVVDAYVDVNASHDLTAGEEGRQVLQDCRARENQLSGLFVDDRFSGFPQLPWPGPAVRVQPQKNGVTAGTG